MCLFLQAVHARLLCRLCMRMNAFCAAVHAPFEQDVHVFFCRLCMRAFCADCACAPFVQLCKRVCAGCACAPFVQTVHVHARHLCSYARAFVQNVHVSFFAGCACAPFVLTVHVHERLLCSYASAFVEDVHVSFFAGCACAFCAAVQVPYPEEVCIVIR